MKILFIIQGEGRGHLTQALSLRQKLMAEGHEIVGVLVGKSPARRLPDFFLNKIQSPVYPFESPNFLPTAKNKQVSLMRYYIMYCVCINTWEVSVISTG